MTQFVIPTSDVDLISVMNALWVSSRLGRAEDPEAKPGRPVAPDAAAAMADLVPPETLADFDSLFPSAEAAYKNLVHLRGAWRAAAAEVRAADNLLSAYIRDTWSVLTRRNRRLNLPPEVAVHYQLPSTYTRKLGKSRRRLLTIARQLLDASARAEAAGAPPLTEPDLVAMEACLLRTETAFNNLDEAKSQHLAAIAVMQIHRRDLRRLCQRLGGFVRAGLHTYPSAQRRDIMRGMGFLFKSEVSETEPAAEDDTSTGDPTAPETDAPMHTADDTSPADAPSDTEATTL